MVLGGSFKVVYVKKFSLYLNFTYNFLYKKIITILLVKLKLSKVISFNISQKKNYIIYLKTMSLMSLKFITVTTIVVKMFAISSFMEKIETHVYIKASEINNVIE